MKQEMTTMRLLLGATIALAMSLNMSLAFGSDDLQLYTDSECKTPLPSSYRMEQDEKGKSIKLYFKDGPIDAVNFKESERQTVIAAQAEQLVAKIVKKSAMGIMRVPEACDNEVSHDFQYTRALITVTAHGNDGKTTRQYTILTGPTERWYLGFDVPLINHSTFKYDATTKTLQPQSNVNPQVYLSINYGLSDVVNGDNTWAIKLLLQAASTPLNSVGLGIGFRLPENVAGFGNLSALSIFASRFWTKQDAMTPGGIPQYNYNYKGDWRVGLSYDFTTGMKLMK